MVIAAQGSAPKSLVEPLANVIVVPLAGLVGQLVAVLAWALAALAGVLGDPLVTLLVALVALVALAALLAPISPCGGVEIDGKSCIARATEEIAREVPDAVAREVADDRELTALVIDAPTWR